MTEPDRMNAWASDEAYELCIGRWSRGVAGRFVDWLGLPPGRAWCEVGCGTGALTAAILARGDAGEVLAVDPSEALLARARANVRDARATFRTGDALHLDLPDAGFDAAVAGLVLNFVPDRAGALAQMRRVVRPGGLVGFYVWDYPGGGLPFVRAFWTAAAALDRSARELTEDRRFAFCTPPELLGLARAAGLAGPEAAALEQPAVFRDFDDLWRPFTFGAGTAQAYCARLAPAARERLRERLSDSLPREPDGTIALVTRAWAVRAAVR